MEAPTIPIDNVKPGSLVGSSAPTQQPSALTEELLYPDRAILTSESEPTRQYTSREMLTQRSIHRPVRYQTHPIVMGCCDRRGAGTSSVVSAPRLYQAPERRGVGPASATAADHDMTLTHIAPIRGPTRYTALLLSP